MAASKFDTSSCSPDRTSYAQRGSYSAASLDRPGSFRENMENPILSSLPSMSRSSSAVSHGDVLNFLQCLRFDPKVMAADHKFSRQVAFKRLTSVVFGIPVDDSPSASFKVKPTSCPSLEELKRLKAGLCESSIKARERLKIFTEALSAMNKCFPSIPSRKRSRSDVLSTDRLNTLFPSDRTILGSGIGKMGTQNHSIASGFEFEPQKSEERTKIAIPNKRTRTSMVDVRSDVRANTPARPSGNVDRDKEVLRLPHSGTAQVEERALPIGVDGWEKTKMKKKRSGIKPDVSPSKVAPKPIDGYREPRQGMQPMLLADAWSRLNDSHGFSPGVANGAVGVGKADDVSQPTSLGMRSSMPKADQDNSSGLHDRRDRPAASSDKERANARTVNKTNSREDFSSASPTSNPKMNSATRAPRSGSNGLHKLSPVVQRTTVANDWELSHCTSKSAAAAVGANNHKRTPSNHSSSPPVAHWAGQRPQKISRAARRSNFVPIVPSNDESPALDATSDVVGNENESVLVKRLSSNSPKQVKSKGDRFSTPALSESKESGVSEFKPWEKGDKAEEMDEKTSLNVQKVSIRVVPQRKNKPVSVDDLGDAVCRQGRTGRGFTSTRSLMPMTVEKIGNVGTAKQLRSARLSSDKSESKAGRPPTRKLSNRRSYTRQKHTIITTADFLVGLDDGHEEILAAAASVINPAHCISSSFWRQMESYFSFISDVDIAYLKQQGNLGSTAPTPTQVPLEFEHFSTVPNKSGLVEPDRDTSEIKKLATSKEIPLCQRLIAALVLDEGNEELCYSGSEDLDFDVYSPEIDIDTLESHALNHRSLWNFQLAGRSGLNGYRITANDRPLNELDHTLLDTDVMAIPGKELISKFEYLQTGLHSDQEMAPGMTCSAIHYGSMSLDERIILEMLSVGLYIEPVPDLIETVDEIGDDIKRLEDTYHEQVTKKKSLLGKLLNSALERRELQEKDFEHRALDKLVAMAYEKYTTCRGSNPSGGKSASSKVSKQASPAFVKRTLERCQKFEDTGKSCFSELLFRDMFLSSSSHHNDAQLVDCTAVIDSDKQYINTSGCSLEVRVSAPMGAQQNPSFNNHDMYFSNALLSANYSSEQSNGKEDTWSNRVKTRELFLDDVGRTIGTSTARSGIRTSLSSSAKGKRTERDREGKGNNREVLSRNGSTKVGRPASGNIKGERKSKAKPKQKTTQLSASVNGLLGNLPEQHKETLSSVSKSSQVITSCSVKEKDEFGLGALDEHEAVDFSYLQLPGMDVLGVPDDLVDQGQDIGSWLNIDDDGLQDLDNFNGLEIPMDDLADLNMMA